MISLCIWRFTVTCPMNGTALGKSCRAPLPSYATADILIGTFHTSIGIFADASGTELEISAIAIFPAYFFRLTANVTIVKSILRSWLIEVAESSSTVDGPSSIRKEGDNRGQRENMSFFRRKPAGSGLAGCANSSKKPDNGDIERQRAIFLIHHLLAGTRLAQLILRPLPMGKWPLSALRRSRRRICGELVSASATSDSNDTTMPAVSPGVR